MADTQIEDELNATISNSSGEDNEESSHGWGILGI